MPVPFVGTQSHSHYHKYHMPAMPEMRCTIIYYTGFNLIIPHDNRGQGQH